MNKEEKEAIEWLKRIVTLNKKDGIENTYAEIVLNLIEKQSKEIEELKKPKYIINFKTNEITTLTNNFISKDKIKAKIEELENEKEKYFEKQVIQHEIDVLQSLLEKE